MTNFQKRIVTSIIILPLSFFFLIQGGYTLLSFLFTIFFLGTFELFSTFNRKPTILFLDLILILSLYSIYFLTESGEIAFSFLLWVIILCICSDVGGYVFGKIFKWKKLTKISPKKTISGSIGSFICSLSLIPFFFQNLINYNILSLLIITLLISLTSQIGDLFISLLKRKAKVKDTSDLLPGHGGVLDRIDGILFSVPIGFLLFKLF